MANQHPTLSWQALEFPHHEKSIGWYVALVGAALLIAAYFVLHNDIFAAITTAVLAGFVFFFARQKPRVVTIELDHKAVKFGRIVYPYKQLKYFWVVHTPEHKTVNFAGTTYINNTIILELADQEPDEVREFLLAHLPEHEDSEPTVVQKITHRLKF